MTATVYRASRITRSRRLSLMRGASWLPLAAIAMMSYAKDARAQAVNLGGMQARMPAQPQARATVPAGVQRQSPGNSIVTDGQTATNVRVNGNTTTITTQTMSGGNAFNSFKTFSAAEGNTVNLIVPDQAGKLVNIVREGQVNIQGTLNSYQNGRIGGNVVFADSYGLVVGAKGSVNVGSLTVVTPNKSTIDAMIVNGKVNDGLVARVVTGDVPLSPDGSVVINGRVNAAQSIKITATDIKIAGSLEAAKRAAEQKAQFAATVNTRGWKGGGQLVAHGGSISISGANSVAISGTVRAGGSRHNAGAISVASGKSVHVTGSLKAEGAAGRGGGKINVTSGGDIAIGATAKMSVAGVGKNSDAGEIIVKADNNLNVADGAKFDARGGTTGNGGFVELSAVKTVTLGTVSVQLSAAAGKVGTLLIDPEELVIGGGNAPTLDVDGNIRLLADKKITVQDGGVIDTTAGQGSVFITAPNIILSGGSKIVSYGSVTLTAQTTLKYAPTDALVTIGDELGKRVSITAKDLIITATSDVGDTANASVVVKNADVTLSGKFDVTALATVNKSATLLGLTDVSATIDVSKGAVISAASATLAASANTTLDATMAGTAAAAVVKANSTAGVSIGRDANVSITGALKLSADNVVSSTSKADASSSSAVSMSLAVNVLKVNTSAVIADSATIKAGSLSLAATTSVAATTSAKASAQGGKQPDNNSDGEKYLSDYKDQASTSDGGVKAAGALAIADITSNTLTQMTSQVQAKIGGATTLSSITGNASSVVADGSSATGANGVGVAVGIGVSKISNRSLLDQKIEAGALDVSAIMTGTAADNTFSVSATSGAAASNVGVAGALAANLLDSESWARIGGAVGILNNNRVSVTSADLTTATAMAGPSGVGGGPGAKVGIGASVALNLVATRSTAELADGASVSGAGAVALKATGEHVLSTTAEQGSEGGVAVTPVIALTMASDRTQASIGRLSDGLVATGDVTIEAGQRTTALTQASGTAAGGKAGIGAALAVAVLDEQTIATTSSSINTTGSVSFSAKGAALVATAAVASASGGKETDSNGNSTDGDATADAKIAKATDDAGAKQKKAGVGTADQQKATDDAAKSGKDQGKTSDGSVAVAAAIGATLLDAKVQAYVPAAVGIRSGALSITSVANADAKTTADGSAVGSKDASAKVGVGVGLSLNLVRLSNDALLGIGSPLSSGAVAVVNGVTPGQYSVTSLALKATQDDLGAVAPVVTVKSPAAVDAAKLAKASIVASTGQRLSVFESNASAGAGASSVGVAGAVALNLIDTQSSARVGGSASVVIRNSGAITLVTNNESSVVARAMPAGSGAAGDKVGVGASVALNLVATRSTAELEDNATITDAGKVTLQATGVHGVVTQAEQGSKGGVSVTPVIALTMASDWTRASIGALNGGLVTSGDISVGATQLSNALTQASGTAAGGQAGIGAALAVAILDEQTTATTASSIKTAGSVSFTAKGAVSAATAAVASASGGATTDDNGKSTDKDATADAKIQKEAGAATDKQKKAGVGSADQQTATDKAAKSQDGQGKTSDGSVAVAAAIGATVLQSTLQAYVPAAVGVKSGALSLTAISNTDTKTTADGSAVGSKDSTATVGVGVGLSLNLVRTTNDALLGDGKLLSAQAGTIVGIAAGTYDVTSLSLKAAQDELGVAAPVLTAKSPAAVDAAKLAKATITASTGQHLNVFEANASAGAGASNVGVAGAVALNLVDTQSKAQVASGAVVIANNGDIKLAADNESSIIARAMPAGTGASGDKVGVGAAAAINLAATRSTAELATDARISGAHDVTLQATGVHGVVTQAEQGSKGGVAVTPVIATTLVSNRTQALIGALVGGLDAGGDVSVAAQQRSSALTQASGAAAGGKAAVGAALAVAVLDDQTIATTASSIKAGGAVSFSAKGASLAATAAVASASGGNGADDAGKSTDKDGSVDQKVQKQSGDNADRMKAANIGDNDQQTTVKAGGANANDKAKTDEGGVAVAAAIAVDVSMVTVKAYVPSSVGVDAKGALSVTSVSNVDAKTSADGAASAAGSSENKVGVGAAVAVNVVIADNIAELGSQSTATGKGQLVGVTAGHYGGSDLTVAALKTDLGTASPAVVGGMSMPKAASATTTLGRLDQIVTLAKSGASGAKVGLAGSLAVNVLTSKSVANVAEGALVTITPVGQGGAVKITADNEAYVAAQALAWQSGNGKVGVGASAAFNYVSNSSEATLAKNADVTGATSLSISADQRLDTDALAEAGAKGGTALDAVIAVTILNEKTAATIAAGSSALDVDGAVSVRASSGGTHNAFAEGSSTSSGGGTAIGGAVALITGTGLFTPQALAGGPVTTDTSASVGRHITAASLALTAEGKHAYVASATATASGGNPGDVGSDSGSKSTSSQTLGSEPAKGAMDKEQTELKDKGQGNADSGGKLSVAAAVGAAIVGDSVKATIADGLILKVDGDVVVKATSTDQVQALGNAASVSTQQDNGIGIGAALAVVGNTTSASIGKSVTIQSGGGDVTVAATSQLNNGLGGFMAEAMSGASGKKLAVAGALAIGFTNSSTNAIIDNGATIVGNGTAARAGDVSVAALNTSSIASKAWSGSYSGEGFGIGASIAAAISNDKYNATVGNSVTITAGSLNVSATNARVDDVFSSLNALAQPIIGGLTDINKDILDKANATKNLIGSVNSAAAAQDAVASFKDDFAKNITKYKNDLLNSLNQAKKALDLPLLGSNNFYTEVVAGAASAEKLAVAGGLALQVMLQKTKAEIGTGATINVTDAVAVAAQDNAISRTIVGALAGSAGQSAAGISLGIIVNSGTVDALIGKDSKIFQSGSIDVTAKADHNIDLFAASAGLANANGIAGVVGVIYSEAVVNAKTGTGSKLDSSGLLNVAASNTVNTLNLAGGVAIGGNNGVGGTLISTTVRNKAIASIESGAGADKTTVDVGGVKVSADTSERLINVAVAGAGAGSNAIAGVATPLLQFLTSEASIGANADVTTGAGGVSVNASDNTLLVNVGGVVTIGGSNGVGGSAAVGVVNDTVRAFIANDVTINSAGSVVVAAKAKEIIVDAVVSGSGGGNVAVAVALASSILTNDVSASIGKRTHVTTTGQGSDVRVEADDSTLIVDIAGTIGVGGNTGVGAGVDANVLKKSTSALIDENAEIRAGGNVVVQATSAQNVFSLVAGFAAGGDAGVAGSVGSYTLKGDTLATIAKDAFILAQNNVAVIARDSNELNRLIGSGAVGGNAGVGGAIGVSVAIQNTKALIDDRAQVEGLGTYGTIGVITGIKGSYSGYLDDVFGTLTKGSSLGKTSVNEINPIAVVDGLQTGGSLMVLKRTTTPVIENVRGVAVSASATSLLRSAAVSGSAAGTAGISISGDLPVMVSDTQAIIGANTAINKGTTTPNVDQSVTVAASSDLYHLGVAGSVAVGGTAGVGAGAETAIFNNTTQASIGTDADVSAARNVAVTARASENFAGASVSAAAGGTAGVAGGLTGFVSNSKTTALIDSNAMVFAGGNVIVIADDQTRAAVTGGTLAIGPGGAGVGLGIGFAVIVKDTNASIGAGANVTGLGNGNNNDLNEYTGTDFTSTRAGRGVLVQANSGQTVAGFIVAGAGGVYAGVAGAVAAEVFVDQTRASIAQNAVINDMAGVAHQNQDVTVTARSSTVVAVEEAVLAGGIAGVGGAVDVAVIADATSATIGDNVTINAKRDVNVLALSNRQTSSIVASVAGGIAGVGAAISVLAIANGPDADQSAKMNSNGSFNDNSQRQLSDDSIDSKFLSSSTNSSVRDASKQAQSYKKNLTLQQKLPTNIPPGNSATIGNATVKAGGSVNVRATDIVDSKIADGAVAAGIGGGAGIAIAVVDVDNTAKVANGADITAGAMDVAALSKRAMDGYGVAATAAGVSAALVSLTDATTTTATITSSTVKTDGGVRVHAENNEQITIATATLASGAAGGLNLVVLKPDTQARIDGGSTIDAATTRDGAVEVSALNTIGINSGAAGVAVGGGGGVGLSVITEFQNTVALVGAGSTITSGVIGAGTAGDVLVSATTRETMLSLAAGLALGDGLGGALTVLVRKETTNAEVEAATITATGNVGVTANSTSSDDLAIGGAAVGSAAGVGGSIGVTVLQSTVTASIDKDASVTALGLGSALSYIKAYKTEFSDYLTGDKIKPATLAGVSGGLDIDTPLNTNDVSKIGSYLLLKKGTINATLASTRGVVVNAAKADSVRSVAVSGGVGGLVGVGLSGNVPVILNTTTATVGEGAKINQDPTGAGAAQSVVVAAASDTYSLNVVGAVAGGGAAGVGASLSTAIIGNTTSATIGAGAKVAAKNDISVSALAAEDLAMIAAAGAAGGYAGIAGGLSLISIDNTTRALIDSNAVVKAGNNVAVIASDSTREATFAGGIALSGGGSVGAAISVGLIKKTTEATIASNAKVTGLANGSTTFKALTGSDLTASRDGQGVLVDAESVEAAYVFSAGGGAGGIVAAAGAITVNVFNTNTYATINSGAVINGDGTGSSKQDVAVTARDLAGIVSQNYGASLSGLASLAGSVDVGVLNSNVGASIGDSAKVNAERDVLVTALANKAIDSTAMSAAVSLVSLSAGVSVYSIGDGFAPNGDAFNQLKTSDSSGGVTNFAGSKLSVGNQLGATATGTVAAANKKNASGTGATDGASDANSALKDNLGSIDVSGKVTALNAAVAGTSATIGNATINAKRTVALNGRDQVGYNALTGTLAVGGIGAGAGIGMLTNNSTTTATITGTGAGGAITAGSVSVAANTVHDATIKSYAGTAGLVAALQADVAVITDNSVTRAGIKNFTINMTNGLAVEANSVRTLDARAAGLSVAGLGAAGVSLASAVVGGSVNTTLEDLTIDAGTSASGAVSAKATSSDKAKADAKAVAGGIGIAANGAEATARVELPVTVTIKNDHITTGGDITLAATAANSANANAQGIAIAGGIAGGGSIATASLAPQVKIAVTGGSITGHALNANANVTSGGAVASAGGTSAAIFAGFTATSATASDASQAIATGSGGSIEVDDALNFNASNSSKASASANGRAFGIVAAGSNNASATTNTTTSATFTGMTSVQGGTIGLAANSTHNTTASSVTGSGGLISGASSDARTTSTGSTVAQISGPTGAAKTLVYANDGALSLTASHTDNFSGTADSTQAAVAGKTGARLTHLSDNTVIAGLGKNVTAYAQQLTIDASQTVQRYFICETGCNITSVDQMGWDVKAGAGGIVNAAAATGSTTVKATTLAGIGDDSSVRLLAPVGGVSLAKINASNNIIVHQKTKVDALGAIQLPRGESNVDVTSNTSVTFGDASSLLVDIGDVKAAAWSTINVDARTNVSAGGVAGAAEGAAKAFVTATALLSVGSNARVEASNGTSPSDGTLPKNGTVSLLAGRSELDRPQVMSVNTVVDVYNDTAFPVKTSPDAVSQLTSNANLFILAAPQSGASATAGVHAAGDIALFADKGTLSSTASGTGKDIYREAGSKFLSFFSNLFGGGDISLDIKGGSATQNGQSTLIIDSLVDTGVSRSKSVLITYKDGCSFSGGSLCIEATGNIVPKDIGTFQAGGAILDRLGQIDALIKLYDQDTIAKAAYQSERVFLQDKLVSLGLAYLDTANGNAFTLKSGVTAGAPAGSNAVTLKALTDAIGSFQSEVTTNIGTYLTSGLSNLALSWNGTKLDPSALTTTVDSASADYSVKTSAESALASLKALGNYNALAGGTNSSAVTFQDKVSAIGTLLSDGTSALTGAIEQLKLVKKAADSIAEQVRTIVGLQQDVAQGAKPFDSVSFDIATAFGGISGDQGKIVESNRTLLNSINTVRDNAATISQNLNYIQTAASTGSTADNSLIATLNVALAADKSNLISTGALTRVANSAAYIKTQVDGGTLTGQTSSGQATSTVITGMASRIADYKTAVDTPTSGKTIAAWQADLNDKAKAAAAGTAGSVGNKSTYIELPDVTVQLGNIYLGADTIRTGDGKSDGPGKLLAPGDAQIKIINETAATLKLGNLNIPINNSGRIIVNNVEVSSAAGISAATGKTSYFQPLNVVTSSGNSSGRVTIESNYNPDSDTYYNSRSTKDYIKTLQMAPDIILQSGKMINNPTGAVDISSAAGNIYIQGTINAASISIVARNGDLVTSYVNGFYHVGGDPATKTLVPGGTITPEGLVPTGLGMIANGQIFLSARYLNINSTVQSGIAEWQLTLEQTTKLVTTDANKFTGVANFNAAMVAQKLAEYGRADKTTNPPKTYDFVVDAADPSKNITLDLVTGQLTFSIATVRYLNLKETFKFADTQSARNAEGIYTAQVGASYDGKDNQVVIDATTVRGGYIKIFGQIINTSPDSGSLNVLDGFGTINITNNINIPVVLSTLNAGADTAGNGRGTAGKIDITDVHLHAPNSTIVDATHTVITRDTSGVKIDQQQGIIDAVTGLFTMGGFDKVTGKFVLGMVDTITSVATKDSNDTRAAVYNPMQGQRYIWQTVADYAIRNAFDVSSNNTYADSAAAIAGQAQWSGTGKSQTPSMNLLPGAYVSVDKTLQTTQTIDPKTGLVTGTTTTSVLNKDITDPEVINTLMVAKGGTTLTQDASTNSCTWMTSCTASNQTSYYTMSTDYRQITTHSLKADNKIRINFIGSDTGTINVTSGSDVTLRGNITNVSGDVSITANNSSIIQGSTDPTITAKSIALEAGKSIGGASQSGSQADAPVAVMLTSFKGNTGKLDAMAGNGVVSIKTLGDLIVGQVRADNAVAGKGSVTLFANGSISAASSTSLIQADRVALTSLTGSIGSVANDTPLHVNTGFTTDQSLRPFGDPATIPLNQLQPSYGLSASALGDINIYADAWANNSKATILANSIVSAGGDVKLKTPGQVLDGNPIEQIDKRTADQLIKYWESLGLTKGTENQDRQDAAIAAFVQSQNLAYRQYWQLRLGQSNNGASYDPNYQITYTPGTERYQSLYAYYRNIEIVKNGGTEPTNLATLVMNDIANQATADTLRYRELNAQVGSFSTGYDSTYGYTASVADKTSLTQGATWSATALGFPLNAGALKTVTNTNPVLKDPNVSGRNVTILAAGGIGETVIVNGKPGIVVTPVTDPAKELSNAQKIALATAERSDLVITIGGLVLPANATSAQIAAYNAAVALGLKNTAVDIPVGLDEANMTIVQRAALDAAAAGVFDRSTTYLTVLSKRPLNVASSSSLSATVSEPVTTGNIDQGKAFIASRGSLALGEIAVSGETRIKTLGTLTNADLASIDPGRVSSIKTGNIVLESAYGSIGLGGPLLLNLQPNATITARALNLVNLYALPGAVNGSPDAIIDTVYSPNDVRIRAAGSILNANNDRQVNVLGAKIVLTADTGSIGSLGNALNVGNAAGGNIRATANSGLINLYGVAGLDFTVGAALSGTSTTLVAANDGTIDGPVTAGTGIIMSAGQRWVITGSGNVISAAGDIDVAADTLKMLRGAQITAQLGSVRVDTVHNALVSGIVAGSSSATAIDITAGGHVIGGENPDRVFDLATTTAGAGIRIVSALGIGDVTQADRYAVDQKGMPVGSANLITNIANPLRISTNVINASATVGDINLITLTSINAGSVVTGGGSIDVDARQDFRVSNLTAIQGDIIVTAVGALSSANVLATRDAADARGHVDLSAGADIDIGVSRSAGLFAQTPAAARFRDATVDNPFTVAAKVTEIDALHASGYKSTPLIFTLTGYRGGIGERARVYVDAPMGVVMPLLRENEADIRTNALDYAMPDAFIGRWMKFTAPLAVVWADNRTPKPVLGFDVQLFQPLKQFYMFQNGVRTFTNAAVVQYSERAEVIEWRNVLTMPGGSLVRDIDRIGTFTGVGSVLLRDDSPDYGGAFFRGDAFVHFMEALRDRRVRRPIKGPVVNLKGLASTTSLGD